MSEVRPSSASSEEVVTSVEESEKFAALLYVCDDTRQWIIQADTKGGFLLTINGVVAGLMVPKLVKFLHAWNKHTVPAWALWLMLAAFVGYGLWQLVSFWHTTSVFVPRTPGSVEEQTRHSRHVFNYSLARHFPRLKDWQALRDEMHELNPSDLEREYLARLQVDAMVCNAKYSSFLLGFRSMLWALGFAFVAFFGTLLLPVQ